jgi:glycosyltransferase involved in cell wall biosynthesis
MDIALSCYLSPSGLSRVGQEYFKLLSDMCFRVIPVWLMAPQPVGVNADLARRMGAAARLPLDRSPIQFHTGLPQSLKALKDRSCLVGSVVVEGNSLSHEQSSGCAKMDAVFVPSTFCRNTCMGSGIPRSKIHYVPYPLDSSAWNPAVKPWVAREDRFRFLFINSWYERKGYDCLLRAWWEEFSADDPVELVVKSYRENSRQEPVSDSIKRLASGMDLSRKAPVKIVDQPLPDELLPGFMASFDCLVSPHRSEGFGMNIWYAMALGVPVICTDYGGSTDFCKTDTAWLVSAGRSRPSPGETALFPFLSGMTWAEPDVGSLRSQMRECLRDKAARTQRASEARALVAEKYAPKAVAERLSDALRKASPRSWEMIHMGREAERLAAQPAPRFEAGRSLTMPEI